MLADGFLSPIDTVRAKLQEQIGYFLSSRQKLINLMSNSKLQIQGQARGLYVVQTSLEERLQNEITPVIQKVQAGTWDSSDILTLGGFTMQLMQQINSVNNLERAAGGASMGLFGGMDFTTMAVGGAVLVTLAIMGGVFVGRRSSIQS